MGQDDTKFEQILRWLKNQSIVVVILVLVIVVTGVGTMITNLNTIGRFIWPTPKSESVFVNCQVSVMPPVIPAEGRIDMFEPQEGAEGSPDGVKLSAAMGRPGEDSGLESLPKGSSQPLAYQCTVTNYSTAVLFGLKVPLHLTFRESVSVARGVKQTGKATSERDIYFTIAKLDPTADTPFEFYVRNCCVPKFIDVTFGNQVTTTDGRNLTLLQPEQDFVLNLTPIP